MAEKECIYKILLLGDDNIGKTSILLRYTDRIFNGPPLTTIGLDYRLKSIKLKNGKSVKLQIWDTAGQDRFRAITKNYYKAAHGIILIYDVTDRRTFQSIRNWVSQIRQEDSEKVTIYLVANKIDKEGERKVEKEEGENLAKELGLPFIEVSAKDGINVDEIFEDLVERIYKIYGDDPQSAMKLSLSQSKKKKNC